MSGALGFILNAAGFIVPLALTTTTKTQQDPKVGVTNVQIITGIGGDSPGGNVPHIALWDDDGNRIGQFHPSKKEKTDGMDEPWAHVIEHNQNGGKPADPYYVMLSNLENDAICIASVSVSNTKVSGVFYGDTGYMCGQSWYPSENRIGANFQKPKCVWLDADHTNGLNARALSFHLNDMAPSVDKIAQYQSNPETLCQSTPRFSFWGNLLPDGIIPFFDPKLEYNEDSANVGEGADKDPSRVVDKPNQYDKSVYLHQGENTKRFGRMSRRGKKSKARGSNHNPEHLIVTHHTGDNVTEVCESKTSYGWDIVSTVEGVYCDMENKKLYPVCNHQDSEEACFDLDTKTIAPRTRLGGRDDQNLNAPVPGKAYKTHAEWK